ncbi:MAG: 4-alpha-glucanotransferase [Vampirovibrionales bacterium]|nr:4-alpha-glucanotransferase [Vampirovibrionales bacterium]
MQEDFSRPVSLPALRFGRAYTPEERALAKKSNPQGLQALGKVDFFVNIHDYSLPNARGEYEPVGSPYTKGGRDFFRFAAAEGFNGVQFAPQGLTHAGDVSPYGANFFSRNTLSVALKELVDDPKWLGLISSQQYQAARKAHAIPAQAKDDYRIRAYYKDDRLKNAGAFAFSQDLLHQAYTNYQANPEKFAPLKAPFDAFKSENKAWLEADALFETLNKHHTEWTIDSWGWLDRTLYKHDNVHPVLRPFKKLVSAAWKMHLKRKYASELEEYRFQQFIVHRQHQDFLKFAKTEIGTKEKPFESIGDLPIGQSQADEWAYGDLFMKTHRLGAPPSLTGPAGQCWYFPLLDPKKYERGGKDFLRKRIQHLAKRYTMLRLDHPHGYIDPWVYRHNDAIKILNVYDKKTVDACYTLNTPNVQKGTRLFSAINDPNHPELNQYAKVGADQLNPEVSHKYEDRRIRDLKPEQVDSFGELIDVILKTAKENGIPHSKIISEVLSTCPYPMWAVLEKHGLGRLRVIQKADPSPQNREHVYRSENARPQDWVMTSTHDAPSLWAAAYNWFIPAKEGDPDRTPRLHAEYTASLFHPKDTPEYKTMVEKLKHDRLEMVQARIAAALLSPSQHISLPFNDFLGMEARINNPEEARVDNWTLRVPENYAKCYENALEQNAAANIPKALAMAIGARIRRGDLDASAAPLQRQLEYLGAVRALKTGDAVGEAHLKTQYADVVAELARHKPPHDPAHTTETPSKTSDGAYLANPTGFGHPE